ncbi:hypothetical protein DERF_004468 [Dermatophagoides farinae]|uniref:Uncharacterized protein n=1 Tax=Dermatophagoides farinae TaxID=6954 RepID=A0A922L687_DERFA|nr:hypothetical protein DERF_004468 [Dermatophagoides farinae]
MENDPFPNRHQAEMNRHRFNKNGHYCWECQSYDCQCDERKKKYHLSRRFSAGSHHPWMIRNEKNSKDKNPYESKKIAKKTSKSNENFMNKQNDDCHGKNFHKLSISSSSSSSSSSSRSSSSPTKTTTAAAATTMATKSDNQQQNSIKINSEQTESNKNSKQNSAQSSDNNSLDQAEKSRKKRFFFF